MELLVLGLRLGHLPEESTAWTFTRRDSSGNPPEIQVQVTHSTNWPWGPCASTPSLAFLWEWDVGSPTPV